MSPLAVTCHPKGRRVHVCGKRIHHGAFGAFLVFWGAWLMGRDWADRPWLRDNE